MDRTVLLTSQVKVVRQPFILLGTRLCGLPPGAGENWPGINAFNTLPLSRLPPLTQPIFRLFISSRLTY